MVQEDRSIGFRLKSVNNMIRRLLDLRIAAVDSVEVCGMQGPMISYIYERSQREAVFQRDIEKEFYIRRSTATVMLQTLEQKGLIIRTPVQQDARLKKILPTQKAVEQYRMIHGQIEAFNKQIEEGITPEEKQAFFCILDKIANNLNKIENNGRKDEYNAKNINGTD